MMRIVMNRCLLAAAMLLAAASFLYYLGWGRKQPWRSACGWDELSQTSRDMAQTRAAEFRAIAAAPELSWRGHATMEITWGGRRVVADPIAGSGVKPAPRWFDDLVPDLSRRFDLICLTHAHMDHLDNATLERMPPTRIVLPEGSERFLSEKVRSRHEVIPLEIGQVYALGALEVIPVPARHGGWRYPWQRGLFACGYVLRHGGKVLYLAGDTAMGPHFETIARDYAPDYAVLPIGAYAPQWFLRSRHLNPGEAWRAAERLGVDYVVPYHFGTYRLSLEAMDEPLTRFVGASANRKARWFLPVEAL